MVIAVHLVLFGMGALQAFHMGFQVCQIFRDPLVDLGFIGYTPQLQGWDRRTAADTHADRRRSGRNRTGKLQVKGSALFLGNAGHSGDGDLVFTDNQPVLD